MCSNKVKLSENEAIHESNGPGLHFGEFQRVVVAGPGPPLDAVSVRGVVASQVEAVEVGGVTTGVPPAAFELPGTTSGFQVASGEIPSQMIR